MALLTSDTIKCVTGTPDWIVTGYDSTAGITCQFNDGSKCFMNILIFSINFYIIFCRRLYRAASSRRSSDVS